MKSKLFHIGIKAVILKDGKVLVLKDTRKYEGFDLPGGKIDQDESIEQALKRELGEELGEELGLENFVQKELLYVYERPDYKKGNIHLMLVFYKGEADITDIKLSEEHTSFEWISKDDLETAQFRNSGVKKAIEKVFQTI